MGRYQGLELDDVELVGDRLLLRRWLPSDADAVYAITRDDTMWEYLDLPRPYTREVAAEFVETIGHEGRGEGTGLGCAMVARATGQVVGSAALRRLSGQCDVGYWVAPGARGHGYAAEAARLLAEWGFAHGVPRVELQCDARNLASVRTALASGFSFEGVARSHSPGPVDLVTGEHPRIDVAQFARLSSDPGDPIAPRFPRLGAAELTDGVVVLRPLVAVDAAGWLEHEQDPLTLAWAFNGDVPDRDIAARLPSQAGLDWLVGNIARFTIEDAATGRFAGSMQLRLAGPPQVAGVGYVVHPAFRGRGYTARALRLLATWAFDEASFARLELGAKRDNVASQRAAAAGGFLPDGVRAKRLRNPDGTFSDEVRFALPNPLL